MYLGYAARLIRRKLPWLLAASLLGLLAGLGVAQATQKYTTTSYLTVNPSKDEQNVRAVDPERFFQTESQLVLGDAVMDASAKALGDGTTAQQLRQELTLGGGATNDVLQISATGSSEQQSRARADAVLKGLKSTQLDGISTSLLWTSPTTSSVSKAQYLLGGLLGGAVLGALGILVWGAVRRPVIEPRHVALRTPGVTVYPLTVPVRATLDPSVREWIQSNNPGSAPVKVVAADGSAAARSLAQSVADAFPAGSAAGAGRFIVYTGSAGVGREQQLDDVASATQAPEEHSVLLLGRASRAASGDARRAVENRSQA